MFNAIIARMEQERKELEERMVAPMRAVKRERFQVDGETVHGSKVTAHDMSGDYLLFNGSKRTYVLHETNKYLVR